MWGKHFTLKTDHKSLLQLKNGDIGDGVRPLRLACWSARLLRYTFSVVHKTGKDNTVADALSRLPVDRSSSDDDSFVINALFSDLSAFTVDEVDYASKQDEILVKVRIFIFQCLAQTKCDG